MERLRLTDLFEVRLQHGLNFLDLLIINIGADGLVGEKEIEIAKQVKRIIPFIVWFSLSLLSIFIVNFDSLMENSRYIPLFCIVLNLILSVVYLFIKTNKYDK